MSEQEKKSGDTHGESVLVVEQTGSRCKMYLSERLEDSPELLHKRSHAPAVPSVAEDLKNLEDPTTSDVEFKAPKESQSSSETKYNVAKKMSTTKRRDSLERKKSNKIPEAIVMTPIDVEPLKNRTVTALISAPSPGLTVPQQPIPAGVGSATSLEADRIKKMEKKIEEDTESITEEIAEMHTAELTTAHSEWSADDEAAGGLPRSESRASRVSRAVRNFICCGVRYGSPSEDDISTMRAASGI